MMLYMIKSEEINVHLFNFGKKKQVREAQLEAVKKDTFRKINKASKSIQKVNNLLDNSDITLQIYYATRKKGVK